MITLDFINAVFMAGGFWMSLINCRRIYIDKEVEGVSIWPMIYYVVWGIFGLLYLYILHQYISSIIEIFLIISYIAWVWMAIKYRK